MSKLIYMTSFFLIFGIAGCSDSNSKITIEKSDIPYEKPQTSNQVIKGNNVEFELWFNDRQWEIHAKKGSMGKNAEEESSQSNTLLSNASNDVFVSIQETSDDMPYGESFKHYAKWIKLQGGQIIDKEIRNVNGNDILYIKARVEADSKPFISINYVLTNKSGGVSVTAGTSEDLFGKHETEISDLMNGLVDPKS